MMTTSAFERFTLRLIKLGLWVLPLLPLYVSFSLPFPFVTGKNFAFRILVELLFALWAGLAISRPAFRPRRTPLGIAVTIFIIVILLADLLGPNPSHSLLSDFERMEGFIALAHFYLYFVMLATVFTTRRDWLIFFHVTLGVSLVVSILALTPDAGESVQRVASTIGNPAYLAAYLLFHVWLLIMLVHQYWGKRWLRLPYLLVLALELWVLYLTATRGVILAFLSTTIIFLTGTLMRWKALFPGAVRARAWAAAALAVVLMLPLSFWLGRDSELVRASPVLARYASVSREEANIKPRLYLWPMALKGAMERPLWGWGQENYYLVFQKYLDPRMNVPEPWFDRTHNAVLDWLIQAGLLGLFSYLAVILIALRSVAQGVRNGAVSLWHGMALYGLFIAHFLQNLFLFDNLSTYVLFFAFLAYTDAIQRIPALTASPASEDAPLPSHGAVAMTLPLLIVAAVPVYFLNIIPIRQATAFTDALEVYQQPSSMDQLVGAFQQSLAHDAFGTSEVRAQMAVLAQNVVGDMRYTANERQRFVAFTVAELREECAQPAKNVRGLVALAAVLVRAVELNPAYASEAERVLREATQLSPSMQFIYFGLAEVYRATGNLEKALEVSQRAWELDPTYREAAANLWHVAIFAKRLDIVSAVRASLDLKALDEASLYRLGVAYQLSKQYAPGLEIYDRLIAINPKNAEYRVARSTLLAYLGRLKDARREAHTALRLNPSLEQEAREFFESLGSSQ